MIQRRMNELISILKELRINVISEEFDLQKSIAESLYKHSIPFEKEYILGPRNRVDFFIDGIVIEVKKGKPYKRNVIEQLYRYASFDKVTGIILVIEKNMDVPKEVNSKLCMSLGLNKLWGIAL